MVSDVLFGLKVPPPPVQMPPLATVTLPLSDTAGALAHTVWSAPASTVGGSVKVMVIWSLTAAQLPLPVVVRVSVTLPAAISEAVGVYTAFRAVFDGA